ncbi:MAG: hypothetical protein HYX61_00535 [Gammaproteobacteria bacterium]|nr:hypothetical protein [Gammaproteobacteria bacterium]
MGNSTMRALITYTLIFTAVHLMGCANNQNQSIYSLANSNNGKAFDAMPREGWATDPNLSYRLYSYYPMDFQYGGFYNPYFHRNSRLQ